MECSYAGTGQGLAGAGVGGLAGLLANALVLAFARAGDVENVNSVRSYPTKKFLDVELRSTINWGFNITPHRKRMKDGFPGSDGKRIDLEDAFKKEEHPFRIVVVCAMWLTGFDVPSLSTLYLDKPLKAHTLMQAIARATASTRARKTGSSSHSQEPAQGARHVCRRRRQPEDGGPDKDPVEPQENGIPQLKEAIALVRGFLDGLGFRLERITETKGFECNGAIEEAKDAINVNDETRKRFELLARQVFAKFKACLTLP